MNLAYSLIQSLIHKYEISLKEAEIRVKKNPNDMAEGLIMGREMAIEDLKKILKEIKPK